MLELIIAAIPKNVDKLGLCLVNLEIQVFISMVNNRETSYWQKGSVEVIFYWVVWLKKK